MPNSNLPNNGNVNLYDSKHTGPRIDRAVDQILEQKQKDAVLINGITFDGNRNVMHYAYCNTPKDSPNKYATLIDDNGIFKMVTGAYICILFIEGNTTDEQISLQVGGNNPLQPVVYNGRPVSGKMLLPHTSYDFVFNGENWELKNSTIVENSFNSEVANKLENIKSIDGIGFNGTEDIYRYCHCRTPSSSSMKYVEVPNFKLTIGAQIYIIFDEGNTTEQLTLDVSGTGPLSIVYKSKAIEPDMIREKTIYEFVYNGEVWVIQNPTIIYIPPFVICDSFPSDIIKRVDIDDFEFKIGNTINIIFTRENYAENIRLSINDTKDLHLYYNGRTICSSDIRPETLYTLLYTGNEFYISNISKINSPYISNEIFYCESVFGSPNLEVNNVPNFKLIPGSYIKIISPFMIMADNCTLSINKTSSLDIRFMNKSIVAGMMFANIIYELMFDGICWQLINPTLSEKFGDDVNICTTSVDDPYKKINNEHYPVLDQHKSIKFIYPLGKNHADNPELEINDLGSYPIWDSENKSFTRMKPNFVYEAIYRDSIILTIDDILELSSHISEGQAISISNDSNFIAIGAKTVDEESNLFIYMKMLNNDKYMIADKFEVAGDIKRISWSHEGDYVAIGHTEAPWITIYKRTDNEFNRIATSTMLPSNTSYCSGAAFTKDCNTLAVIYNLYPFVTVYDRDGDTFTNKYNPTSTPYSIPNDIEFSPDGQHLAIVHNGGDGLTIYDVNRDPSFSLTKIDTNIAINGNGTSLNWSSDGKNIALSHTGSPGGSIVEYDGSTFILLTTDIFLPNIGTSCHFSPNANFLIYTVNSIEHTMIVYRRMDDGTWIKQLTPKIIPGSNPIDLVFNMTGSKLFVLSKEKPFLTQYKCSDGSIKRWEMLNPIEGAKCLTDGNIRKKEIETSYDLLYNGSSIEVQFTAINTVTEPTIRTNGKGVGRPIVLNESYISPYHISDTTKYFQFVYDYKRGYWILLNPNNDSYAVSTSIPGERNKKAYMNKKFVPINGQRVQVLFTNNTNEIPSDLEYTLNINDSGNFPMIYGRKSVTADMILAFIVYEFMFQDDQWILM